MSHNYTPQSASLYNNLRPTKSAISTFDKFNRALAELVGCLLEENTAKDKTIEILQTRMQNLEQKCTNLEKRQSYLEYDLHNANANLKAENLGLRQQVDYPSDD